MNRVSYSVVYVFTPEEGEVFFLRKFRERE